MQADRDDRTLGFRDPGAFARLRGVLTAAGFTEQGVASALEVDKLRSVSRAGSADSSCGGPAEGTPLDTLIRLFLIGVPVEAASCRKAIDPMTLEDWIAAGCARRSKRGSVAGAVQLLPYQELWLASDRPTRSPRGCPWIT